jgi:CheY-like chemotaxis protein
MITSRVIPSELAYNRALSFGNRPALILCIEDERHYLALRKSVLEGHGYHVIGAATAEEALEALRHNPICLTVSDHMLRGTTGTRLAARMKQIKPKVPIVLYSGVEPDSLAHVDAFINKDEPTEKFLSMIDGLLERFLA